MNKKRVVLVEDNAVVQQYLKAALASDKDVALVACLANGKEAVDFVINHIAHIDVLLLDLFLPGIDGIEVIKQVMAEAPLPIVVISSELDRQDRDLSFEAQRAGAVSILPKPFGMELVQFNEFSQSLCHLVKLMSQVKVTRRRYQQAIINTPAIPLAIQAEMILIGASTGGPAAIYQLLEALPVQHHCTIIICQHIAEGFAASFAQWLGQTGHQTQLVQEKTRLEKNRIYIAPDHCHVRLNEQGELSFFHDKSLLHQPNIDTLFHSFAEYYHGKLCAILLTGMGRDGAQGLLALKDKGALTIAESEKSCVIYGMPKAAIEMGAATISLDLTSIASLMAQID